MTPSPRSAPPPPNWFMRHRVLTVLGVLLLLGAVFANTDAESGTTGAGTDAASSDDGVGEAAGGSGAGAAGLADGDRSSGGDKGGSGGADKGADPDGRGTKKGDKEQPEARPEPGFRTYLVTRVVDGDTIELGNGHAVRIVGIDTPEVGECGYEAATAKMERLVLGERVRLTLSDEDQDRYGRLLRYVDVGKRDAGLQQIKAGLAIARYDSRDGYGYHRREGRYVAADRSAPDKHCAAPEPRTAHEQPAADPNPGCAAGYAPCVPLYPPDVDCAEVNGPITVAGADPHGLDADGDGVACEW